MSDWVLTRQATVSCIVARIVCASLSGSSVHRCQGRPCSFVTHTYNGLDTHKLFRSENCQCRSRDENKLILPRTHSAIGSTRCVCTILERTMMSGQVSPWTVVIQALTLSIAKHTVLCYNDQIACVIQYLH